MECETHEQVIKSYLKNAHRFHIRNHFILSNSINFN